MPVKCLNQWDPQSKRQYMIDGAYATLQAMNSGGGRCDGIVYAIEGHVVDRNTQNNGKGWCDDVSPTLNTQDGHAVIYENESVFNESGKGYWMEGFGCIRAEGENRPSRPCHVVVAIEGNGSRPSHQGNGYHDDGTMYTLNTIEQHAVCYAVENHHHDSRCKIASDGIVQTLSSRMGTGGNNTPMVLMALGGTDSKASVTDGDVAPTMLARAGTGGNEPIVLLAGE